MCVCAYNIAYAASLSLCFRVFLYIRKYFLSRGTLKNIALCCISGYIVWRSDQFRRSEQFETTSRALETEQVPRWGFSFEERKREPRGGGDFARRRGIMQPRIGITANFHFAKHSRPTSFFTCNSLEEDTS